MNALDLTQDLILVAMTLIRFGVPFLAMLVLSELLQRTLSASA